MSLSTKSKPASPSSPATGAERNGASRKRDSQDDKRDREAISIDLEVSRQRWIAWTIGGIIGGAVLVMKLGTVGVWAGYVVIALGLFRAYQLAMSFVHPPGKIIVTPKQVTLPRGVHRPRPLQLDPSAVTAVYFLRRSVPWNRSAPVLVIELGERAMAFPRDWFASEADQRHIVHALLRHLPDVRREPDADAPSEAEPASSKS